MGRPPHGGGPVFRFTHNEVLEMEARLQEVNNAIPSRETICALAQKFSTSADRAGKTIVQPKQVWNWFQNRRYAQRAKSVKAPGKLSISLMPQEESISFRHTVNLAPVSSGRNKSDSSQVEFEAKSARDGAWYDVSAFISHRLLDTGDPEVRVRFSGFGVEEDEWVNVHKCVRQRSLPCESGECVIVLPGDLILCFQEGKEQALYFDAHVLDAQRRRHDIRGCRCRFLVRYAHDQSEEIVPLRKVCRRPETDYRLQKMYAAKALGAAMDLSALSIDPCQEGYSKEHSLEGQKPRKLRKLIDINIGEVTAVSLPRHINESEAMQSTASTMAVDGSSQVLPAAAVTTGSINTLQESNVVVG